MSLRLPCAVRLRHVAVAVASLALASTALPAHAAPVGTSTKAGFRAHAASASRWQASQLTKGRIHNAEFDFDDWGLSIDSAFALAAVGNEPDTLARTASAIEHNYYSEYVAAFGLSAGAAAKTLLVTRVLGVHYRTFGGRNVRHLVLNRVAGGTGFEAGRLRDGGGSDFSNTIVQAYGVLGLSRSGGVPRDVVDYLRKQQCSDGYFRLPEQAGQTCDQIGSPADVDATALALEALVAARTSGRTIPHRAIPKAAQWLVSAQRRNGSFGGGTSTSGANTNSTGLAAVALSATNHDKARRAAADWVARYQLTKSNTGDSRARRAIGAIAYNQAGLKNALSDGIQVPERDQFRRATAQAIFAFAPKPLGTLRAP